KQNSLDIELKVKYLNFVSYMLQKPDLTVKIAMKSIFRKKQVRSISEKFGVDLNSKIVCLPANQWKNCFLEMLKVVPEKFHPSYLYCRCFLDFLWSNVAFLADAQRAAASRSAGISQNQV